MTWKTRLRCAFNKAPDIEEVKAKHNRDAPLPYKVYKFLPKQGNGTFEEQMKVHIHLHAEQ